MDCSLPGLSVHGVFQARILESVAVPFFRGSSLRRDRPPLFHIAAATKPLQSFLTLCDPIDGSPPGSPVPGILRARTLEWVAISFCNETVLGFLKTERRVQRFPIYPLPQHMHNLPLYEHHSSEWCIFFTKDEPTLTSVITCSP